MTLWTTCRMNNEIPRATINSQITLQEKEKKTVVGNLHGGISQIALCKDHFAWDYILPMQLPGN